MHDFHHIGFHNTGEPGSSGALGRVNARTKLVAWFCLTSLVLMSRGAVFPLMVAAACFAAATASGVAMREYVRRFAEPAFMALVLVLVKSVSIGEGMAVSLGRDGLIFGLFIAARIFGAVSLLLLLAFTTPFTSLLGALSWLRIPKTFIEILMLAHRYIFVLMDDAQVVYQSQKNRMGYAGMRRGLKSFGTLTGSVMIRAIDQSAATATAMMQRGYTGSFPELRAEGAFRLGESVAALMVVIAAASCFAAFEAIRL
ncbi:MAG: cobalt ECF transporter T component CbiQ [Nitrospirae bacterium]|nr:cobalt ECF transporter T component CbiQ [Nitrospirota bacterium]